MKKILCALLIMFLPLYATAEEGQIFAGKAEKIYSPQFTANFILYIMDPERVAGWAGTLRGHEVNYMAEKYQKLPVFDGWWQSNTVDKELLIKHKVKKAFIIDNPDNPDPRTEDLIKLGMDVLIIPADELTDYISLLRELGVQMGIPARGEELAAYGEKALARVAKMTADIKDSEKPSVYFAHGPVGLNSFCKNDMMDLAAGINVLGCELIGNASPLVNFEQIMAFDPDVVVASNPDAGPVIINDPKWMRLRAWKEGNLYIMPFGPFSWMHMPEITRFMGVQWLACTLHPDQCDIDIRKEAKYFTKLFMHIDVTDAQLDNIMHTNVYKRQAK